jgi:hypothetical protein
MRGLARRDRVKACSPAPGNFSAEERVDSRRDNAKRLAELRSRYGRKTAPLMVFKTTETPPRGTTTAALINERTQQLQRTIRALQRRLRKLQREGR